MKADRGLAGRMVCARCGHPLGLGVAASRSRGRRRRGLAWPRRWRGWLALAGLLGVSAALAAQAPAPDGRDAPPGLPSSPRGVGWPPRSGSLGM